MQLHTSRFDSSAEEWERLKSLSLKPIQRMVAGIPLPSDHLFGLEQERVVLPDGTEAVIDLMYSTSNQSVSITVAVQGAIILNVGCFKGSAQGNDPSICFRLPSGQDIQLIVGP